MYRSERKNDEFKSREVETPTIFSLESFKAVQLFLQDIFQFFEEELDYLVSRVEETIGTSHRGKEQRFRLRPIFLFHAHQTYDVFSQVVHVQIPTLKRNVRRDVLVYFAVFQKLFIPKEYTICQEEFDNFPDAVAVDSITIHLYSPSKKMKELKTGMENE